MKRRLPLLLPLLALTLTAFPHATTAQPAGVRGGAEVGARFSLAAESDLDAPPGGGSVTVNSWRASIASSVALEPATTLRFGAEWTRHELDLGGPRWLPARLQSLAIPLGMVHRWDERWRILVNLQPRFAADGAGVSSDGFDLPVLALASYAANPELTWTFGLRYSAHSDVKLLPLAGAVWRFAPDWEVALTFPESGVSFRATPQLTLRGVASLHGGDYRLEADPRAPTDRTGRSLAGAWLEYREIRAGLAAEYALTPALMVRADAGVVVDQRFDYFDRGVELEGSAPPYFALSFVGRF